MSDEQEEGFALTFPGHTTPIFGRGSTVSLEFPGGEGVTGQIAGVTIAAGGGSWDVHVTHDGEWPSESPETSSDGAQDSVGDDTATEGYERFQRLGFPMVDPALTGARRQLASVPPSSWPRQRVVTEHEQDGSVTIRVELRRDPV
jgi:hypothetical protein